MQLVLDSNEFIFALGSEPKAPSVHLLDYLIDRSAHHHVRVPRSITREVQRHLTDQEFRLFMEVLGDLAEIDEDFLVPFSVGAKYEALRLKPGDAFIAAYADWVGAELLVTENRHFLTRRNDLPFKVVTAVEGLKILQHG